MLAHLVKLADRLTDSRSTCAGINHYLRSYGRMTQLKIDRDKKSADIELELHGETSPIHIHIDRYEFEQLPDGAAHFVPRGVTVSRPWMNEAAKNFAEGRSFLLPPDIARYAAMLL